MFFRVKAVPQAEYDAYIAAQRVAAGLTAVPVAPSATVVVTPTVPSVASPTEAITPTAVPLVPTTTSASS
jgi:hypothetical protein